ncbi:hypothetical protein JCM19241_207 [Vibrio ishigakensis]|uniref:Uncharacterized protein n=1 Tax=Vibrio ishigakensis TaxID=1481914 RepID=A0A0B8QNF4_9VIBR|nr:hypothetical protein JCM19241_207 [Vibrio ishigakensis]
MKLITFVEQLSILRPIAMLKSVLDIMHQQKGFEDGVLFSS